MNELALFAGAGGGILGGRLLGWRTICAVEINEYCRKILAQRQDDGILEPFQVWDDIRTFDGEPWRGVVDIVTGGFPCQDISCAGRGTGIDGERSGLWAEMARIIGEVRPRFALVENSPLLTSRGLGRVLGDMASLGYDAKWGVLGAYHTGAPHKRERIWICAHTKGIGLQWRWGCRQQEQDESSGLRHGISDALRVEWSRRIECAQGVEKTRHIKPWPIEPPLGRVAYGVADRVDRLKAIGNGQVPRVVKLAWRILNTK